MKIRKAVIPAAGLGTRFLPATKALPKEMLPVIDIPTLQLVIEEAVNSGIEDILIIIGRNKESIVNYFDRNVELEDHLIKKNKNDELKKLKKLEDLANIFYVRQNTPKGLGHAISLAESFVGDEPFCVLLGDDIVQSKTPVIKQMMESYEKYQATILGVQEVSMKDVDKYGIVDGIKIADNVYKVRSLVEKPEAKNAPSNIGILGRYIISNKIFKILKNLKPGVGDEIQLTDGLVKLMEEEEVYAHIFEGNRYDMGSKMGYIKATIDKALSSEEFRTDTLEYIKEIAKRENLF